MKTSYLKLGRGDPCAGQSMAKADLSCLVNEKESMSLPNLGLALPMGSKERKGFQLTCALIFKCT